MRNLVNMKRLMFFMVPLLFFACTKQQVIIPYAPVNIYININEPLYNNLQVPGAYVIIPNQGSKGVVIYRSSWDEFIAYDLHATFEPQNNCGCVVSQDDLFILEDPCSSSTYSVISGQVITGPAVQGLQYYPTNWDGFSIVRVNN